MVVPAQLGKQTRAGMVPVVTVDGSRDVGIIEALAEDVLEQIACRDHFYILS
jgi:hypothetical protein